MLEGKKLSVLGDSISTYDGVSNNKYAHWSIGENPAFYGKPFPLGATYWMRILNRFKMGLCVNNSWSGGLLSGRGDPISGEERAKYLATNDGVRPDVIIVFMGINDLGYGIDVEVFDAAYVHTLETISSVYADAEVFCVDLPDRTTDLRERTVQYNQAIRNAVRRAGKHFRVVDLFGSRLNNSCYSRHSLDGLHPDEDGMQIIADTIGQTIEKALAFL